MMQEFSDNALRLDKFVNTVCHDYVEKNQFDPAYYEKYQVHRGLRNQDGSGVLAGVTRIGSVQGAYIQDGERVPMEGKLYYRGIEINELIDGFTHEDRFGFEETIYLLLLGELPNAQQLGEFQALLAEQCHLPPDFTENMIIKAPSRDVMNKLARSILAFYSYDNDPDSCAAENLMRQSLQLIARIPTIVSHAYAVKRHYYDQRSLVLHRPQEHLSIAENLLYTLRPDTSYTKEEARILDLCLVLHAEHGGGNNSAFTARVLSSSGTDTYSALAGAVGALKGPRHGGANIKVINMMRDIAANVSNWRDMDELKAYLSKMISREAGDRSGLIYGMGHAVYTLSDPRAVILKTLAKRMAAIRGRMDEYELLESVETLTPAVFAVSRMVGWCAHRIEESLFGGRIIRPAYRSVAKKHPYTKMEDRQ